MDEKRLGLLLGYAAVAFMALAFVLVVEQMLTGAA